jgi:hypothetical protein
MLVTDKVFLASTLVSTVGCSSVTFRAWRNRNGLFPETQGSGGWNRFSIVDVLVAALVSELTSGGIAAQTAVEAAIMASQSLTDLCGVSTADQQSDVGDVVLRILKKWSSIRDFPLLTVNRASGSSVSIELKKPTEMPVLQVFSVPDADTPMPCVVTIVYLARLLPDVLLDLVSIESEFGRTQFPPELLSPSDAPRNRQSKVPKRTPKKAGGRRNGANAKR